MTIDTYTKFILTSIAIGIWLLAAAIFLSPTPLSATESGDINIERIGGSYIHSALPVQVEGTIKVEFAEDPVFELKD